MGLRVVRAACVRCEQVDASACLVQSRGNRKRANMPRAGRSVLTHTWTEVKYVYNKFSGVTCGPTCAATTCSFVGDSMEPFRRLWAAGAAPQEHRCLSRRVRGVVIEANSSPCTNSPFGSTAKHIYDKLHHATQYVSDIQISKCYEGLYDFGRP